jgi:DNA ligase-4
LGYLWVSASNNFIEKVLNLYHSQGAEFFKYCSDLSIATQVLLDPDYRIPERKVTLGHRFFPQSSARLRSLGEISDHFPDETPYYIQTKLDGWRMLMHYDEGKIMWYSRSNEDFTNLYGKDANSGSLAPIICQQINSSVSTCILDGEVVPYDEETGRYLSSYKMKSVSKGKSLINSRCCV